MKKILLISPMKLPIPSVGGGAVEKLLTHLIDENERHSKLELAIVSIFDKSAARTKYKHSKVFYFDNKKQLFLGEKRNTVLWYLFRLWIKLVHNNRYAKKLNRKHIYLDYYVFQLYQIVKREKIDYIILEGTDYEKYDILERLVKKEKFFIHLHSTQEEKIAVRRKIPNSIAISEYVKFAWVKDSTIPGKNVVLYNGIDLDLFQKRIKKEERDILRKEIGVQEDDFLVIYCGRVVPEKGVKELLEAFDIITDKRIKLLFIGNVDFANNTTTEFLRNIKYKIDNNPNVIYLGYVDNNRMPKYYSLADMQVVPSIWEEGAGLVAIEGMATGLPLLVTKSGGMIEYVNDEASIQVPIDSNLSLNLANYIISLSENERMRISMKEAGIKRAKEFRKEKYYQDFVSIFEEE
ncbi:MAG: glycosyltransferase family 4 protein [Eubacterium sp.]|nr:glycosyltransferase family 4 protein [Eubacterium sp.]